MPLLPNLSSFRRAARPRAFAPTAVIFALFSVLSCCSIAAAQTPDSAPIQGRGGIVLPAPPTVAQHPVTDTYAVANAPDLHVTDDYRWLENAQSPDTRAFIDAQNAYTAKYLDQVKILPDVRTQMSKLLRTDSLSIPEHYGNRFFFLKRLAEENQASLYMREGLHGADIKLVDAASLSADQNTSVSIVDINHDGTLLAYGIRMGGADEEEIHFLDLTTMKPRSDVLPSARYSGIALGPDGKSVYYSKLFPHVANRVFRHVLGGPVSADTLLFGDQYRGQKLGEIDEVYLNITDNGRYLVLQISHGVPSQRESVLVKDLRDPNSEFLPLVDNLDSRFQVMDIGDDFFIDTDYKAPNHRVLKAELGKTPDQWSTIIPEASDTIESTSIVDGKLYVLRLHDVQSQLSVYTLIGKPAGTITLPGIGAGTTLYGRSEQKDGFYSFQSLIAPPTIFHYDTRTGTSDVFYTTRVPFSSNDYELKQVFYTSRDGTRIPMFIAGRKGLKRDGSERLLMTGYGGFTASMLPTWNPEYAWWMQQGGWFALPNLRGGNEYGEAWHKQAMFEKKQNVFDDWFAAAEYLVQQKYTSPAHFAIRGRSNGGLLMGASMTQRPDLFAAIWCGYPLLDMLRYQKFLVGRTWTTEYGSAENPDQIAYIAKYSPYQHVVAGTKYPAILFFTGDGDTRVDPMNARKMTALMQRDGGSGRPILLHYSLKGGHSAGVSLTQLVEDYTDEMSFLWTETQ